MPKRKPPHPKRAPDPIWEKVPTPACLDDIGDYIDRTTKKLTCVLNTGAVLRETEVLLVPTPMQRAILAALSGRLLTKEQLAEKICGGHGNRLYRNGEMKELLENGVVAKRRGGGYFRTDDPPPYTVIARF